MLRCIASILPDLGLSRWLMVELYRNGRNVQFLVCAPAILALTRRYSKIFPGTIHHRALSLPSSISVAFHWWILPSVDGREFHGRQELP